MGLWLRAAVCAVVLVSLPVASVGAATVTATISVSGGNLSVATEDVVLTPDGTTGVAVSQTSHWTAVDARGTGGGWHLTVSVDTIFADGRAIGDQPLEIQLLNDSIAVIAGNGQPTSRVPSFAPVPATGTGALLFVSAASDEGMGSYDLHPDFRLATPTGSTATGYTATLTVDISTGP